MADDLNIDVGGNTDYRKLLALQLMQPQPAARSFGEGLLQGLRGAAGAGMLMYQGQQDEEKRKKLADAISASGGDIEALKTTAPEVYAKAKLKQTLEGPSYGTSPTWGINPGTNQPAPFIVDKSGATKWLNAGKPAPDVTASPSLQTIKRGDQEITVEYDPRSRTYREISTAPRDLNPPLTTGLDAEGNPVRVKDAPGVRPFIQDKNGVEITAPDGTVTRVGGSASTSGDSAKAREQAKAWVSDVNSVAERRDASIQVNGKMEQLMTVLDGLETGKGTVLANDIRGWGKTIGYPVDETKLGNIEYAQKLSMDFALIAMKELKGSDTEFELKKQLEMSPGPDAAPIRLQLTKKAFAAELAQTRAEQQEAARLEDMIDKRQISTAQARVELRNFREDMAAHKIKMFSAYAKALRGEK